VSFATQTIGPDAFGYLGTNDVAFTFTDISATGTVILDGVDDTSVNVPVGFGFSYYGTAYSSVYVSSNVLMTFGASNTAYSNTNLTTTSIGQPAIAVMWDDWKTSASTTDKVYYATSGSVGSRIFTVQWDVTPYSGGGEAIVQCQLFEATGQILLNYLDVQTGNSASNGATSTIGIQDTGGNANGRVLQWSFNTASVFDGMSILFSPRDANLSNLLPSSGTLAPAFTSGITAYSESVSNATSSIAVTPTALRPNSTIQVRVNGGAYGVVTSGASSASLPLNVGVNTVDVLVTSQDTVTTKLYSIAATRRTPYQDWAFGLGLSGAGLDPNGDLDGDGIKNIQEWAFGTNPTLGAQGPINVNAGVLLAHGAPVVLRVPNGLGGFSYFALFGRRKDAATMGLTYAVEFSDALPGWNWSVSAVTPTVIAQDSEIEAVTIPFPPIVTSPPNTFFRVRVNGP
jgi:hypothetical protein